jgi:hypothetical protein
VKPSLVGAALGACTLLLSGCAGQAPEATSSLSMPSRAPELPQSSPPDPTGPEARLAEEPGDTSAPMEDCLVVAAGVSSVLLAPLSFMGDEDAETMAKLEEQLHHLHGKVPEELKPQFAEVADAAERGHDGAGDFDEPAFREALKPVQQWLKDHCDEPAD